MRSRFVVTMGILAAAGCAHQQNDSETTSPTPPTGSDTGTYRGATNGVQPTTSRCPMDIAGTVVRAVEIPGGMALVFTTNGDVEQLRREVTQLGGEQKSQPVASEADPFSRRMPESTVAVEVIDEGAQLVFKPSRSENLQRLRNRVRSDADTMAGGQCPMVELRAALD